MRILSARIFSKSFGGKIKFFWQGVTLRVNLDSQDISLKIFNNEENLVCTE